VVSAFATTTAGLIAARLFRDWSGSGRRFNAGMRPWRGPLGADFVAKVFACLVSK